MRSGLVIAVGVLLAAIAGAVWAGGCYRGSPGWAGPDPTQPPPIPRVTRCMGGPGSADCIWPFPFEPGTEPGTWPPRQIETRNPYAVDGGAERNP